MLNRIGALALWVVLMFGAEPAFAYVGPASIAPASPVVGQAITLNVPSGGCDEIGTSNSFPNNGIPQVTVSGTTITALFYTAHADDPEFCFYDDHVWAQPLGSFPAGEYTIVVNRWSNFFTPPVQPVGELSMTVLPAAAPVSAPAVGPFAELGIVVLLTLFAGLALRGHRNTARVMIVLAVTIAGAKMVSAQTPTPSIEVMVSPAPGAPSPDDIVNYFANSQRATTLPPLSSLTVQNPVSASYLMPLRVKGDALAYLNANPTAPSAMLERYVVVTYPVSANLQTALTALRADPYVQAAYIPPSAAFSSTTLQSFTVDDPLDFSSTQYGRADLNIDAAWRLAGGYALIGDLDTGLYEQHPALAQFSAGGGYLGGNFIPGVSLDIGQATVFPPNPNQLHADVDEMDPVAITDPSYCDQDGDGFSLPTGAGHGTHVSGLLAANGTANLGVEGTCRHCGISMWKVALYVCAGSGAHTVDAQLNPSAVGPGLQYAIKNGASVVNMSLGSLTRSVGYCASNSSDSWCLGLDQSTYRDVAVVTAAGNQRNDLQFPANDGRAISAGGFQEDLNLWDDSPGNNTHCPYTNGAECGSNYTKTTGAGNQELMASAHTVFSTTYPQRNWNTYIKCGDAYPVHWGNGTGDCSGTSMAAPQIAGIVGIMRSANPFVSVGSTPGDLGPLGPTGSDLANLHLGSLRKILSSTTVEAQGGQGWNSHFGFGHPDAAAAARKVLGTVGGATVRNRVTPLFRLRSAGANGGLGDIADTTSPQLAAALMVDAAHAWVPVASAHTVFDYPKFPGVPANITGQTPTANVYVMTTEYRPRPNWPKLVPLYLMDKEATHGPQVNVNDVVNDFLLVTTVDDLTYAHNHGYNLRNIQGYIYKPCTPETTCIPPGAKRFYRACNTSGDCATFLESETGFSSYATTFPPLGGTATKTLLGYAYPYQDTDGDGLVDGFEYVAGTSPTTKYSNGNSSLTDNQRYPMIGIQFADPCINGTTVSALCYVNDVIFQGDFESP